tara:strand:+ start:251 stop:577 length:327 start_codon:yes stop_codon:yes gene_type:complete
MKLKEDLEKKSSHMSVKDPKENSNSELIQRDGITDSPFEVITQNGVSFGTMGQYRLTEPTTDKRKLKRELKEISWNRIVQVVMILDEMKDKLKEVKPIKKEKPKVKKV